MSEVTIRHEPVVDDDDASRTPPPSPQRRSRTGRAVGAAITGLAAVGAIAYGVTHSGSQEVAGTPVAARSADNPDPAPGAAPTPETTPPHAPTTPEIPVATQLNLNAEIPHEQVEKLYGLPEDSFDGHWDVTGPSAEPAPEGVPVPVHSRKLLTPDFNVTVDVYKDQSYAAAVKGQGGIIENLPPEGGMSILSVPQLSMVEGSFAVDDIDGRHNYAVTVTATGATPEAKAEFVEQVVRDFTTPPEQ